MESIEYQFKIPPTSMFFMMKRFRVLNKIRSSIQDKLISSYRFMEIHLFSVYTL